MISGIFLLKEHRSALAHQCSISVSFWENISCNFTLLEITLPLTKKKNMREKHEVLL